MPFTKEQMAKGGRQGKPGKHTRTKQWEELAEYFTTAGAKRVMEHLNNLEDDDEFFQKYDRLLNYFKPKLASAQIDANVKGEFKIEPIQWIGEDEPSQDI